METGILLESGTNELELLEFAVGNNHYGINVAKIRELCKYQKPTPVPNVHPSVEGIFMPRDLVITVISLAKSLHLTENEDFSNDMYIITNFNQLHTAFHVSEVLGIHRVSWSDIRKPDTTIGSSGGGVATGIVKIQDRLIVILDFERIVTEINPETGLKISDVNKFQTKPRVDYPILIAEDSPMLSEMLRDCLQLAGYTNLTIKNNGMEAWEQLQQYSQKGNIEEKVACVITDIEMPQMDGHHLTKLIKEDHRFLKIPVIIFSSLVNEEMKRKGEQLGADAQLSKPEIGLLVEAIDGLLRR